jgi:hypothetical protein
VKDTVITVKQKKRELRILAGCFLLANLLNVLAIAFLKTSWRELFTQLPVIILITVLLYAGVVLIRLLVVGLKALVKRPQN